MKAMNVIEAAYRGTLEEQDDTVVWISHILKGAGAELDVLLCGNAVNYAVQAQRVDALKFGARQQIHSPQIAHDVAMLTEKGVAVYIVAEDLARRGIAGTELVAGVEPIPDADRPGLYERYDQVWHW